MPTKEKMMQIALKKMIIPQLNFLDSDQLSSVERIIREKRNSNSRVDLRKKGVTVRTTFKKKI